MNIENIEKLFVPIDHQEECAICGCILDNKAFPLEFPDDWKFCCGCLALAQLIIADKYFYEVRHSLLAIKIYEKITLAK